MSPLPGPYDSRVDPSGLATRADDLGTWSAVGAERPRDSGRDMAMKILTFSDFIQRIRPSGWRGPVAERQRIPGLGRAVNPARPIGPTKLSLLAPPGRERLKGQVMGRP
jgi:hypothetical protein